MQAANMTIDEAIAEAYRRVPVAATADHAVVEVRLQIGSFGVSATLSRDTFRQDPDATECYGAGHTAVEAIMNAIADYEDRIEILST